VNQLYKLGSADTALTVPLPREPTSDQSPTRGRTELGIYAALGVLGYLLNGLGAVLGPIQHQLGVGRTAVAFYPSLFALALVAVGLLGDLPARKLGHQNLLRAGLLAMLLGAALLTAHSRPVTLVGALVLGCGGALLAQAIPTLLTARQGPAAPAAIAEANAVSSLASIAAPWLVAAALAAGVSWWMGYLLPMIPVVILLVATFRITSDTSVHNPATGAARPEPRPGLEPGPLFGRWCDVLLAVSAEFCMVFWAADALRSWHGVSAAAAPALAAAFLVGMAAARGTAAVLTRGRHPVLVQLVAALVAAAGFTCFRAAPGNGFGTVLAVAGLLIAGMGIALLYPLSLSRVVAAWPQSPDRASARAALASGLAIGIAPLLLARLADSFGLGTAYLIVPILLLALAGHAAFTLLRGSWPWPGRV
jgi:hypothetical protein